MRGQVPGTTRNGGRTKSAINNSQASGYRYVRAPEGVAQCRCLPNRSPEVSKHGAGRWRNTRFSLSKITD